MMIRDREQGGARTILLYRHMVADAQGHTSFWYGVPMRARTAWGAESLHRVALSVFLCGLLAVLIS
jgi:hypothetical protein